MIRGMGGIRVNGEALRALRERSGYGQTEFASMVGIDRAYLSHIEAGRRNPSPGVAKRIATQLRVPIVAILAEVA